MTLDLLAKTKLLCESYQINPQRSKGQNFLASSEILDQIVEIAAITNQDLILEVGPGLGVLTEKLVAKANRVVSVELDDKLFNFLKTKFINHQNLTLVNNDILKWELPDDFGIQPYKIVANLPYNISSNFLKKFLTSANKPISMTLLLQKEVAQRIVAGAGQLSLLGVSVQLYGNPVLAAVVGKENFWPRPQVDSAILKIDNIKTPKQVDNFLNGLSEKFFWQILRIGFAAKRKQLQNNLSSGLKIESKIIQNLLKQANFDPKIRAQNLAVSDWVRLGLLINQLTDKQH
ncbi:MAG: 16S rRNA (adenine(1518)-N(6)/adenine(1519)-N(6))-dimethyltransferase RsmA [Patescibacteria group bacterium]|jgi:16S rRNA (adenine1518-N6/adenine1519-N6)-dimethyltransferase|nr:16S rRNA (adenine(1518)-N(6)/adenine(1519)-N(6))-dimethyltransferase RsmA [Patescibacteria group bacterium]